MTWYCPMRTRENTAQWFKVPGLQGLFRIEGFWSRGHRVNVLENGDQVFDDSGKFYNRQRPCRRCGRSPTAEGYDACIGYLPGVFSACCGHGQEESYCVMDDGHSTIRNLQEVMRERDMEIIVHVK